MSSPWNPDWRAAAPRAARRPSYNPGRGRRRGFPVSPEVLEGRALLAAGSIRFDMAAYQVADSAGTIPIALTRTGGGDGTVSVNLTTSNGSAVAGTDYTTASQTVTFPAGVTVEKVNLSVFPEPIANVPGRTVNLTLTGPTGGASVGSPAAAVLTIYHLAAPGDLDGSSGAGSGLARVTTPGVNHTNLSVSAGLVLPDGSSYAATRYMTGNSSFGVTLLKVKADGTPDTSFGQGTGAADAAVSSGTQLDVNAIVTQTDGKVVVAGDVTPAGAALIHTLLVRFNADGTPDPTFGTNGVVIDNISNGTNLQDTAQGAVVLGNGEVFTTGIAADSSGGRSLLLRLHRTDGSLDPAFGNSGTVLIAGAGSSAVPVPALQGGQLLVSSTLTQDPTHRQFVVYRFNPNGTPDTTFGTNGIASGPVSNNPAGPLLVLPDGGILQAGTIAGQGVVARYTPNGQLDTTFGSGGVAQTGVLASAVAPEPDGKILVGGVTNTTGSFPRGYGVTRLNPDGTPDVGFGAGGTAQVANPASPQQQGPGFGAVNAIGFVPGNNILVTGRGINISGGINNGGDVELARFAGTAGQSTLLPIFPNAAPFGANNPDIETAEVNGLYNLVLGRAPEPQGLAYQVNQLKQNVPLARVAYGFYHSPEYLGKVVQEQYQSYLGRDPASDEFSYNRSALVGGETVEQLAISLLSSPEFKNAHPDNSNFVRTVYEDVVGRPAADDEVAYYSGLLASGTTRSTVASKLVHAPETDLRVINSVYSVFFARAPFPDETRFYLTDLQSGSRPVLNVAPGFLGSAEYNQRAALTVAH